MHIPLFVRGCKTSADWSPANSFSFSCRLAPGLYTVGIQTDMADFNWKSLTLPMTKYGNRGQETFPWDFDLHNENTPLLPTWKIWLNDRCLGIFYLQRPTVEDIEQKTLRGEFGFPVETEGEFSIRGEPYNEFSLKPLAMYLEENAFDRLEPQVWSGRGLAANWAWNVPGENGWDALRSSLEKSAARDFLAGALASLPENGREQNMIPGDWLGTCAFCCKLYGDETLRQRLLHSVRRLLELPAWGNQNPYGYGHNGDMGCALNIKYLSLLYNWLHAELGELREPLLRRLEQQMRLFYEQQLLLCQYWGGACLQDHGYRSSPSISFAALCLVGHSPVAEKLLDFYVPRLFRALDKQPHDGFIPFSQYHKLQLYCNDVTDFQIAYKFASGVDIFARFEGFRRVPEYIMSCIDEESMRTMICVTRGDRKEFGGGLPYLLVLAREHENPAAAWLAGLLLRHYRSRSFRNLNAKTYETLPMACLLGLDNGTETAERPAVKALNVFPDGGAIQYRQEQTRFNVAVMCQANASSFHCLGTDLSGTDMGISNPSMGAFTVGLGDEMLLQTAESGYRTGSKLGNVLLIDGKGQYGDMGYPMGVPMRQWRGQRIQNHSYDPATGTGFARLNLAPAYPEELRLLTYTRDFHFAPDRLLVRDTVIALHPHRFSYWFNTFCKHRIRRLADGSFEFQGDANTVRLELTGADCEFRIDATEVIWAYGNEQCDNEFQHLEIKVQHETNAFTLDFIITPVNP